MNLAPGRRRRPAAALAAVALVAAGATLAVLLFTSQDPSHARTDDLQWVGRPQVMTALGQPRDRILTGRVRNDSPHVLTIEAARIRVVDRDGRRLAGGGIFIDSFVRGMYAASRRQGASDFERRRTGRLARLARGGVRPLTVAWRTVPGHGPAARIDFPGGSLPIPH